MAMVDTVETVKFWSNIKFVNGTLEGITMPVSFMVPASEQDHWIKKTKKLFENETVIESIGMGSDYIILDYWVENV